jgi:hypothetical protein
MLRELRSCVTLLRELRIVNQSYAQWPSDSNPEFPTNFAKCEYCPRLPRFAQALGTDNTWHETLEHALGQAAWEFGVLPEEWTDVQEPF